MSQQAIADRFKQRVRRRNRIERALVAQLGKNQNEAYYLELIKDYLFLWDTMQELKFDIETRGVSIYWQNSETQYGYKKNDSIGEMTRVSQQMLRILDNLGIEPTEEEKEEVNGNTLL